MKLDVDPTCLHSRSCPISGGQCPGECVFADVMRSASLGILVFDKPAEALLFANTEARAILESAGASVDYAAARAAFGGLDFPSDDPSPETASCRIGARLVGYTKYRNRGIEWLFCRDISEKARLESVAEAIELSDSFGHVFAAVRHELGNPINSAKMALTVLRRNFDRLGRDGALDYLDSTLKELERVEDLLASLRSFSLYEDVRPRPLAIDAFLEELIQFAARDFRDRGIGLQFVPGAPGVEIHADPRALRQVLMGLCANAADAMAGQRNALIAADTVATDREVILAVRDNGPGIPPDSLSQLFLPFFTTKSTGTGLGLVIARKMLARMSATIAVENDPGRGANVLLTFPRFAA